MTAARILRDILSILSEDWMPLSALRIELQSRCSVSTERAIALAKTTAAHWYQQGGLEIGYLRVKELRGSFEPLEKADQERLINSDDIYAQNIYESDDGSIVMNINQKLLISLYD